jgi:biotin carboxyl carrier protein
MTREVVVAERTARIEIDGSRVRYESIDAEFSITRVGHGQVSVLLNGRSYSVTIGARGTVVVNGRELGIEVFDPRDLRPSARRGMNHGRQEIAASMPGKVVRLLVAAGDSVEEGQGIVVVEAMKMQNEMKSPKTGRVAEVRTRPEATVAAGDVLVVIE